MHESTPSRELTSPTHTASMAGDPGATSGSHAEIALLRQEVARLRGETRFARVLGGPSGAWWHHLDASGGARFTKVTALVAEVSD